MDVHPLTCCRTEGGLLLPQYFTEADHPWLRALLDERERYIGRTRREWDARQLEPLPVSAPKARLALATYALERSARDAVRSPVPPVRLRATLFRAAARLSRDDALAAAASELIFPDFALRHRRSPERHWLVELVGFWTREYIERKLRALRGAKLDNLILCIDAERNCAREDLPEHARIIHFRKRVDARQVLAIIEACAG